MRKRNREMLVTALMMIDDGLDKFVSTSEAASLSDDDAKRIIRWAGVMMFEASDNDCRARCAPKCLRQLLPADHYLQTWRLPKRAKIQPT